MTTKRKRKKPEQSEPVECDRPFETEMTHASTVRSIQALQRERRSHMKSRIMLDNRLTSSVAVSMGYRSGLDEDERKKAYDAARKVIQAVRKGEFEFDTETASSISPLILEASRGIKGFDHHVKLIEKHMVKLAETLPVASWVKQPEQRGFGMLSLAIIVGECGDLAGYANPGKLWRRMGCAPFESRGVVRMGAKWRQMNGKGLAAAEWEEYGYCPRRRSIMHVIAESLMKQNGSIIGERLPEAESTHSDAAVGANRSTATDSICGPYRARYDQVKAAKIAIASDEWPLMRCHKHAMLLMSKLLLRELWKAWNPGMVKQMEY